MDRSTISMLSMGLRYQPSDEVLHEDVLTVNTIFCIGATNEARANGWALSLAQMVPSTSMDSILEIATMTG